MKRRDFLKLSAALALTGAAAACGGPSASSAPAASGSSGASSAPAAPVDSAAPASSAASDAASSAPAGGRVLVAYFSATGNTAAVAETIAGAAGAELFALEPVTPYTDADLDYNDSGSRTSQERADPALQEVPLVSAAVDGCETAVHCAERKNFERQRDDGGQDDPQHNVDQTYHGLKIRAVLQIFNAVKHADVQMNVVVGKEDFLKADAQQDQKDGSADQKQEAERHQEEDRA